MIKRQTIYKNRGLNYGVIFNLSKYRKMMLFLFGKNWDDKDTFHQIENTDIHIRFRNPNLN